MERSLVLLKPDALNRGIVGEIITRFEKDTAGKHYGDLAARRGEAVFGRMVKMLTSGPVVAIVLEGVEIVEVVRKMIGATEPKVAAPGTIRGDYAHVSYKHADSKDIGVFNLIHASGSSAEAEVEIGVWFKPEELFSHKPAYTKFTIHE